MRLKMLCGPAVAGLLSISASAATLVHDYEFNGSGVTDSAGSVDGALFGDAAVSGGYLHLDGDGDYAQLSTPIFPYAPTNDFSIYFAYSGHTAQPGIYTEVVSQDGGNFYVGSDPAGNIRLGDGYGSIPVVFPLGAHAFLVTSSAVNGTRLYIDGTLAFSGAGVMSSYPWGGSATRFGRQFGPHAEFFRGDIDAIRMFTGVATYAEAAGIGGVPEPASWAMMLAGFGLAGMAMRRTRGKLRFA